MRNHQLHSLIPTKLVHIQLVGQFHPTHRRVRPDLTVHPKRNAVQFHRPAFALEHHFKVPLANHPLLDQLEHGTLLSLNRYCRQTGLSRRAAEHLLAKFVRYDIVEPVFENHKFYFRIKDE